MNPSALKRIGITGVHGFLGSHLRRMVAAAPDCRWIPFEHGWFANPDALSGFLAQCDAVVHFAGLSRDFDGEHLYHVNLSLAQALRNALNSMQDPLPQIFFASTTHIAKQLPYHASKRDARILLEQSRAVVVTLRMPNAFGEGSRPFFNSVVSTFSWQAAHGETPDRMEPVLLKLIYADELCAEILNEIRAGGGTRVCEISHTAEILLPDLWEKLKRMKVLADAGKTLPETADPFDRNLFRTFVSYIGKARDAEPAGFT